MSRSLLDLLKEPFGPYLEEEALTSSVPNTTVKNVVALECLLLEGNGRITGLDECEKFQPEYDQELYEDKKVPVRFRGILEIQRLTWLTPEARTAIEKELRDRDLAIRLRSNPDALQLQSSLTLKNIYGPGNHLKVKVKIQGTQANSAVYLFSNDVPTGLLVTTHTRRYVVTSMHICTYKLSRRYLSRYRLHYILRTLLALDARSSFHSNNRTPLEKRTPRWFVDLYCKHVAYHGPARLHRPIFSEADSDIERGTPGRMKRGREHVLRHVSKAEVFSRIAEHAEWLIHEQSMDNMGKWIDVDVWAAWLRRLDRWRRAAKESGRSFGVWDEVEVDIEDGMDIDDLPLPPDPTKRKKKAAKKNTKRTSGAASPAAVDVYPPQLPEVDASMMRTYDPDFSPPSTTLGSPVGTSSRPSTPTDPSLLEALPVEMFHPPNVNSLLLWPCPWEGCFHTIDLLYLKDEDMDHPEISQEDKRRFRSKDFSWDGGDVWARDAFAYMVDKHHRWHLEELGVAVDEVKGHYHMRWKTPTSHPRPEQFRQLKIDDRDPIPEQVKEEDS